MEFFNIFKGFLGFPTSRETPSNDYRSTFLNDDTSGTITGQFPNVNDDQLGFNVFSNPVEMHIYFEKRMNDVLKSFGFPTEDSFFGFGHNGSSSFMPSIEEPQYDEPSSDHLRDYYLKPGYKQSTDPQSRSDDDMDGKIDASDLDGVFNNENSSVMPFRNIPRIQMFGQSVVSRTIRNSDGTIETHRTVKDHDGNEETTVTRKHGDQEYTVITKIDKDGKKEVIENLLNLDDKDVQKFLGSNDNRKEPENPVVGGPHNWFPYEKYFK